MSELISTHYERHRFWRRSVAFIIHSDVLLVQLEADAVLALTQTDQTIVFTAAADDLLQELG